MIEMTYNEALRVQDKQFEHYKQGLSQAAAFRLGNKLIKETKSLDGIDPDEPVNVRDLHHIVPRGTWFEDANNMAIWARNRTFHPFRVVK